jgi:hypothetical protein
MKKIFLAAILIVTFTSFLVGQTGKMKGKVIDRVTKEPLIGVNVTVEGTTTGAVTDSAGIFIVNSLPCNTVSIRVSLLGYKPQIKTDIVITNTKPAQVHVELEPTVLESKEGVTVRGEYFYKPREVTTSEHSLSFEEIRRAPGAASDISRMVQSLPGVVQTTDSRNDLIVRGGSPSENLTIIDGFEIPSINHFGSQGTTGGAIGMVETEFISEVFFHSGGFPVQYGDRLSSVMDIRFRNGSEHTSGSFDLSMAGAGGIIEGPIGQKTDYLFSIRRSFLNLLSKSSPTGNKAIPIYQNINGKVTHKFSEKDIVSLFVLSGWDNIHINQDSSGFSNRKANYDVNMDNNEHLAGISYKHVGEKGFSTVQLWFTRNDYTNEANDFLVQPTDHVFQNDSREDQWALSLTRSVAVNKIIGITAGIGAKQVAVDYDLYHHPFTSPLGTSYNALTIHRINSHVRGDIFAQATYKPIEEFVINAGGRINYFNELENQYSFDPRFGCSYTLMPDLTLNASYGIFHQAPDNIYLFGGEVQNTDLDFIKATQTIVGLEYLPLNGMKVSVEGYIKDYKNYPVSLDDPRVSMANSGDSYGIRSTEMLVSKGTGRSMGIDFFVQQKLVEKLYGLFSYSYSQTLNAALDGVQRSGSYDIPHVFTISGGYIINTNWEISSKFHYVSGRPMSGIDEAASRTQHELVYDLNRINTERYPDYWRLDIRVDYRAYFDNFNIVAYLDFENVTNRENIWDYAWDSVKNERRTIMQWKSMPVGGIKVEF